MQSERRIELHPSYIGNQKIIVPIVYIYAPELVIAGLSEGSPPHPIP